MVDVAKKIEKTNLLRDDYYKFTSNDDMSVDEDSTASLLASVKKQEKQFALLAQEIEDERKSCIDQLKQNQGLQDFVTSKKTDFGLLENLEESDTSDEIEIYIDEEGIPRIIPSQNSKKPSKLSLLNSDEDDDRIHSSTFSKSSNNSVSDKFSMKLAPPDMKNLNSLINPNYEDILSVTDSLTTLKQKAIENAAVHLDDIIKLLTSDDINVQKNGAAYLQHLSYVNDRIKNDILKQGGIPLLVDLLNSPDHDVAFHACGALRNISFGQRYDKNKLKILKYIDLPSLMNKICVIDSTSFQLGVTGLLLNMSAHPEIKIKMLGIVLDPITNLFVIPYVEMKTSSKKKTITASKHCTINNAFGILRNLSSVKNVESRQMIRRCNGLVSSLIEILKISVNNDQDFDDQLLGSNFDDKVCGYCVCILRNLTYRIQDETPYWKDLYPFEEASSINRHIPIVKSCFSKKRNLNPAIKTLEEILDNPNAVGAELLWQPSMSSLYFSILNKSADDDIIEAALGAVQNLTCGVWKWAVYARYSIRIEKHLPSILELVREKSDDVVRCASLALRNLSEDPTNKALLGKYGMQSLVERLSSPLKDPVGISDATILAVLFCIRVLVFKHLQNVKYFTASGGIKWCSNACANTTLTSRFDSRIQRTAQLILKTIWANRESRSYLKNQGWTKKKLFFGVNYNKETEI